MNNVAGEVGSRLLVETKGEKKTREKKSMCMLYLNALCIDHGIPQF